MPRDRLNHREYEETVEGPGINGALKAGHAQSTSIVELKIEITDNNPKSIQTQLFLFARTTLRFYLNHFCTTTTI